jgi:hypothetical protein
VQVGTRLQGLLTDGLGFDLDQFTQEVDFDFRCHATSNQVESAQVKVNQPRDGAQLRGDQK